MNFQNIHKTFAKKFLCDWYSERTVQRPQQQPPPQPQLANIFGDGQSANQFNLGPFTAFTNFQQRPVVQQQQQPLQQSPAGTQNLRSPASTSNLGFEAVRNTVVHDSSSQSSSFFSFQRPEFSNQRCGSCAYHVDQQGFSTWFLNRVSQQCSPTGFIHRVIKGVSAGFQTRFPNRVSQQGY